MDMKREVAILSLVTYFLFLGAGSSQMFLIPYLNRTFSNVLNSLVLAVVYMSIILGILLLNVPSKGRHLKNMLVFGVTGYVVFPFLVFLTKEYILLITSSIYWGVTVAFFWISTLFIVLNISDEKESGTSSGTIFFGAWLGTFFGTNLLGLVQKTYGYDLVFPAAAFLSMLAFLPIYFLPPSIEEVSKKVKLKDLLVMGGSKIVTFFYFLSCFGYGILIGSVSCVVSSTLGPSMIGPILSGYSLISALFSIYGGKVSDLIGRKKTFIIAFFLGALGLFLGSISMNPVTLIILCILVGFQGSAAPVNAFGWIGDKTRESGRLSSICSSFVWNSIGVTSSLLLSSTIYEFSGSYQTVFFLFGILSLFCSILAHFLK